MSCFDTSGIVTNANNHDDRNDSPDNIATIIVDVVTIIFAGMK